MECCCFSLMQDEESDERSLVFMDHHYAMSALERSPLLNDARASMPIFFSLSRVRNKFRLTRKRLALKHSEVAEKRLA
jgi:hypothetical protein